MNRTEARRLWQRVADGDLEKLDFEDPDDLQGWIRAVAAKLLEVDGLTGDTRRGEIVRAVHLFNKPDGYAELRALVNEPIWQFPLDGKEEPQADLIRKMAAAARCRGLLTGVYAEDEKKAHELLRGLVTGKL